MHAGNNSISHKLELSCDDIVADKEAVVHFSNHAGAALLLERLSSTQVHFWQAAYT